MAPIVNDITRAVLTDNASSPAWLDAIASRYPWLTINRNAQNLGFCGAHNQGAYRCMIEGYDGMLVLNPDVELGANTLNNLWKAITETNANAATPLIVRSENHGIVDAAGMYFTPAMRHFDRYAGQTIPRHLSREFVVGGTGACLLLTTKFLTSTVLEKTKYDADVWKVYPQLRAGEATRLQLFDEAFFAYREDAELALRSQMLGLKTIFVPDAMAIHGRGLKPEERSTPILNCLGVKNRFLLQMNVIPAAWLFQNLLPATFRNLVVAAGVLIKEKTSIQGLKDAYVLRKRAIARKEALFALVDKTTIVSVKKWFADIPYTEKA